MTKIKILGIIIIASALTWGFPATVHAPKIDMAQALALHPKKYAQIVSWQKYHWGKKEFQCLNEIWTHESHWNSKAKNPHSTAMGIAQLITETNPKPTQQIRDGMRYVVYRYGTPCKAWAFWKRNYWY
jgi:hypothetical protein